MNEDMNGLKRAGISAAVIILAFIVSFCLGVGIAAQVLYG